MADPLLRQILPPEVTAVEAFGDDQSVKLFPEEEEAIARAVDKRRREFATARACARAALAQLGEPPVPIPRGLRGEPKWPEGLTGSITHCDGYRAAAVTRLTDVAALGLDAEPDEELPGEVLDMIALDAERAMLAALGATEPSVRWDRLLFCAKESVYKAWFPLARRWLGFEDAHVTIAGDGGTFGGPRHVMADGSRGGTFTAKLLVPGPRVAAASLTVLRGRWLAARGLIVTAVLIPAGPPG